MDEMGTSQQQVVEQLAENLALLKVNLIEVSRQPGAEAAERIEQLLSALYSPSTPPEATKTISNELTNLQNHASIFRVLPLFLQSKSASHGSLLFAASALCRCVHRDYTKMCAGEEGRTALRLMVYRYLGDEKTMRLASTVERIVDAGGFMVFTELIEGREEVAMKELSILSEISRRSAGNESLRCALLGKVGEYILHWAEKVHDETVSPNEVLHWSEVTSWWTKHSQSVLKDMTNLLNAGAWAEKREAIRCMSPWTRCGLGVEELDVLLKWITYEEVCESVAELLSRYIGFAGEGIEKSHLTRITRFLEAVLSTKVPSTRVQHAIAEVIVSVVELAVECFSTFNKPIQGILTMSVESGDDAVKLLGESARAVSDCLDSGSEILLHCLKSESELAVQAALAGLAIILDCDNREWILSLPSMVERLSRTVLTIVSLIQLPALALSAELKRAEDFITDYENGALGNIRCLARDVLESIANVLKLDKYFALIGGSLEEIDSLNKILLAEARIFALQSACVTEVSNDVSEAFLNIVAKLTSLSQPTNSTLIRNAALSCIESYVGAITSYGPRTCTIAIMKVATINLDYPACRKAACDVICSLLNEEPRNGAECHYELIGAFRCYRDSLDIKSAAVLAGSLVGALCSEQEDELVKDVLNSCCVGLSATHAEWSVHVPRNIAILAEAARSIRSSVILSNLLEALFPALERVMADSRLVSDDFIAANVCGFLSAALVPISDKRNETYRIPDRMVTAYAKLVANVIYKVNGINVVLWLKCLIRIVDNIEIAPQPEWTETFGCYSAEHPFQKISEEQVVVLKEALMSIIRALHMMNALDHSLDAQREYLQGYFRIASYYTSGRFGKAGVRAISSLARDVGFIGFLALSCAGASGRACLGWWISFFEHAQKEAAVSGMVAPVVEAAGSFERLIARFFAATIEGVGDRIHWSFLLCKVLRTMGLWSRSRDSKSDIDETIGRWVDLAMTMEGFPKMERLSEEERMAMRSTFSSLARTIYSDNDYGRRFRNAVEVAAQICSEDFRQSQFASSSHSGN